MVWDTTKKNIYKTIKNALPAHHNSVENQFEQKQDKISHAKKPCNEIGVQEIIVKRHSASSSPRKQVLEIRLCIS